MNDFELHYLCSSRSRELIAEAEAERLASRTERTGGRPEGLLARLAKAVRRSEADVRRRAGHYRLAK